MNPNQIMSLARWLLNAIAGGVISYTAAKSPSAKSVGEFIANLITGPDVISAVVLGITWLWGHLTHAAAPGGTAQVSSRTSLYVFLIASLAFTGAMTGCNTTPQRVAYQAAATTTVTVETAIRAYDVFVAGKTDATTISHNQQVKAAYEKYQAAAAVVCDAGAIYAATSGTNAPAASLALQQASANLNGTISDVVSLVKSFGVKL